MKAREVYKILKSSALIVMPLLLLSCKFVKEDTGDCKVYFEFIYDYNMEYADSFEPQVNEADVFLFDSDDKYLFSSHGGKEMSLDNNLYVGKYTVIAIGGLGEHFSLSDLSRRELTEGITTPDDLRLALRRTSNEVSEEFLGLWFGKTVIDHRGDGTVWPVRLIKNTNRFTISLVQIGEIVTETAGRIPYTFEIVAPEGGVYDADDEPVVEERVTYKPYSQQQGRDAATLSVTRINTMRLFQNRDYRFNIYDTGSGEKIWDYSLITLLSYLKPDARPDGSELPLQEFLDRQSEWSMVFLCKELEKPDGSGRYMAIGVMVADWIWWLNELDI